MDLAYTAADEAFRAEIGEWLTENLPPGWGSEGFEMTSEERKAFNEQWPKKLFAGGWICATWPKEYGGKGLTTHARRGPGRGVRQAQGPVAGRFLR